MADDLRTCAEHGKKYGVLIGVQNHGDMLKTADEVLKIVQDGRFRVVRRDRRHRLLPDARPVRGHRAGASLRRQLADQGKAGRRGRAFKTDLKRLVRIIRDGGYRGYLPIETLSIRGEAENYDPRARVKQLLAETPPGAKQPE